MDFSKTSVFCFLACYVLACALEWTRFLGRSNWSRVFQLGCGWLGLVAHTIYLTIRSQTAQLPPLLSSSHDWMLVLAWLAVLSYLFLSGLDRDLAVGVFLLPIVLGLIGATYLVSEVPNRHLDSLYGWKMLHASLLVLGILGVLVGFVLALMYLFQQYRLKNRQLAVVGFGVPSLEKLSRLNRWSILISVPTLTLGMLTGVGLGIYSKTSAEPIRFADPVIIGNLLVWCVMVGVFFRLILTSRNTGRQVALLTFWSGGFLLVTLVGLQVLTGKKVFNLESWHVGVPTSAATQLAWAEESRQ